MTTSVQWVEYAGNPVLWWDTGLLDGFPNDEYVLWDGAKWVMYYVATIGDFSSGETRIFRATTTDRVTWVRDSVARLTIGASGQWDDEGVERPCVLKLSPTSYVMWYAGADTPATQAGFRIGRATSSDGITWAKDTVNNPVVPLGGAGAFDEISILGGTVVLVGATYWMFYTGMRASDLLLTIGAATSSDGIAWTKLGQVMALDVEAEPGGAEIGLIDARAVWFGDHWEMYYVVPQQGGGLFGPVWHARSVNGTTWVKDSAPVLRRSPVAVDGWTAQGIQSPCLVIDAPVRTLWVAGLRTDYATYQDSAIGYADLVNVPVDYRRFPKFRLRRT